MAENAQQAWGRIKADFIQVLGDYGPDKTAWGEMRAAMEVASDAAGTETEEASDLFLSYLFKFEGQGIAPRLARQMAKEAAGPRPQNL